MLIINNIQFRVLLTNGILLSTYTNYTQETSNKPTDVLAESEPAAKRKKESPWEKSVGKLTAARASLIKPTTPTIAPSKPTLVAPAPKDSASKLSGLLGDYGSESDE